MPFLNDAREMISRDIEPLFLEAISKEIAWDYHALYEELEAEVGLTDECRLEEFNRRRGDCVRRALVRVAERHRVPYQLQRLSANGQHKVLIQAGRVLLLQETIDALEDRPDTADYKRELADTHGYVRQLEFDFGDRPTPVRDWSGHILAVLLHGPSSRRFTRPGMMLGSLMLAVPDAAYQNWVLRIDLHDLAMFGSSAEEALAPPEDAVRGGVVQPDEVVVRPKRRNRNLDFA